MVKKSKQPTLTKITDTIRVVVGVSLLLLLLIGFLYATAASQHGAPACSEDNASKAAEAYKACIQMQGHPGELGGYSCGLQAYKTYCGN